MERFLQDTIKRWIEASRDKTLPPGLLGTPYTFSSPPCSRLRRAPCINSLVIGPPQVRPGPVLRGGQHQAGAERGAREEAGAEGCADGDQEEWPLLAHTYPHVSHRPWLARIHESQPVTGKTHTYTSIGARLSKAQNIISLGTRRDWQISNFCWKANLLHH